MTSKRQKAKQAYTEPPREMKIKKLIKPRTKAQGAYMDSLSKYTITIGVGPAGCGKTYLAIAQALKALADKTVERIVITRPVVESDEKLGFLPGDINEKMDPYIKPIQDAVVELVGGRTARKLFDDMTIEICPLAYMRGRTFKDAYIIADEMSSSTVGQMKNLLTRIGEGSIMAILGDPRQSDLPAKVKNGLSDLIEHMEAYGKRPDGMRLVYMSTVDIVRHPLISTILEIYGEEDDVEGAPNFRVKKEVSDESDHLGKLPTHL